MINPAIGNSTSVLFDEVGETLSFSIRCIARSLSAGVSHLDEVSGKSGRQKIANMATSTVRAPSRHMRFVNTNPIVSDMNINSPSTKNNQRQLAMPSGDDWKPPSMPEAISDPVALAIKLPEVR